MIKSTTGEILKLVGAAVISYGVSQVVNNVAKAGTPYVMSKTAKVFTAIGVYSISWWLGDVVSEHIVDEVSGVAGQIQQAIKAVQDNE